jgi:YfiH family protein
LTFFTTAKNITSKHGFFGRAGGVSEGIYESLNCGVGSSDNTEHVTENRARVMTALGCKKLITLHQTHSNICVVNPAERVEGDAIVSTKKGLAIGVLTADCLPLLLEDRDAGIVAVAHAGWKGALGGIVESTIATMRELGAKNISAAIGHCLLEKSFEVQQDFIDLFLAQTPENSKFFQLHGASTHFNNIAYVTAKLQHFGITNIEVVAQDTLSQPDKFFSYRHSCKNNYLDYGRQISAISL